MLKIMLQSSFSRGVTSRLQISTQALLLESAKKLRGLESEVGWWGLSPKSGQLSSTS